MRGNFPLQRKLSRVDKDTIVASEYHESLYSAFQEVGGVIGWCGGKEEEKPLYLSIRPLMS